MKYRGIQCELLKVFQSVEFDWELSQAGVLRNVQDGQIRAQAHFPGETQQIVFLQPENLKSSQLSNFSWKKLEIVREQSNLSDFFQISDFRRYFKNL